MPNKGIGIGGLCSGFDFRVGGFGTAHPNVFADGGGEKKRFLLHDSHQAAQASAGEVSDVVAVEGDAAASEWIEIREQVHDRGFASPGWPDDGDHFALVCGETDVVEDFGFTVIGKRNVIELHIAGCVGQRQCVWQVFFRLGVHDPENPFGGGQRQLQGVDQVEDVIDGAGEIAQINEKSEDDADCDACAATQNRKCAGKCDQQVGEVIGHVVERADDARKKLCPIRRGRVAGVGFIEAVKCVSLVIEKLHQLLAGNIFFNLRVETAECFLLHDARWVIRAAARE